MFLTSARNHCHIDIQLTILVAQAELINRQTHHGGEKAGNSYGKPFAKSLLSKSFGGIRYQTRLVVLNLKKIQI